jgi:hypothetical protein
VEAESNLQQAAEQAAMEDVSVVRSKAAAPIDEVVLPAATQPFVNSPIYARTNGYLVKWFYDIGARRAGRGCRLARSKKCSSDLAPRSSQGSEAHLHWLNLELCRFVRSVRRNAGRVL